MSLPSVCAPEVLNSRFLLLLSSLLVLRLCHCSFCLSWKLVLSKDGTAWGHNLSLHRCFSFAFPRKHHLLGLVSVPPAGSSCIGQVMETCDLPLTPSRPSCVTTQGSLGFWRTRGLTPSLPLPMPLWRSANFFPYVRPSTLCFYLRKDQVSGRFQFQLASLPRLKALFLHLWLLKTQVSWPGTQGNPFRGLRPRLPVLVCGNCLDFFVYLAQCLKECFLGCIFYILHSLGVTGAFQVLWVTILLEIRSCFNISKWALYYLFN